MASFNGVRVEHGDINTHFINYRSVGGSTVRRVTVSVEPVPLGENCWAVKVNNGTDGPITGLEVDVHAVDDYGKRILDACVPAKGHVSLAQSTDALIGQVIQGAFDSISKQANTLPGVFAPGLGRHGLGALGVSGEMLSQALMTRTPLVHTYLAAMMTDSFGPVVAAGQAAMVIYRVRGLGELRADIRFDDEDGNRWLRPFNQAPRRIDPSAE